MDTLSGQSIYRFSPCDFGRLPEGKGIDKQRAVIRIAAWHVVCFAGLIWPPFSPLRTPYTSLSPTNPPLTSPTPCQLSAMMRPTGMAR